MRICIVGGALQGMESVYLSKKAGYETVVMDRRKNAPAMSLCDVPVALDPLDMPKDAMRCFSDCDAVLPACENMDLLVALDRMTEFTEVPFMFDMDSYLISSSKNLSNDMMRTLGVPIPREWPECGYPAVVKPSSQSGSVGVTVVHSARDADAAVDMVKRMGDEPVAQEFVSGKGISLEVIGNGSSYRSFAVTEVMLDSSYDCKRVRCHPGIIDAEKEKEFRSIGQRIAECMDLNSLMDVEVIDTVNGLRVLEIDARMPSQTPAAVFAATGLNILEELVNMKFGKDVRKNARNEASSYEHFTIKDGRMASCGEKEFSKVSSPRIITGEFGADEMITDYVPGACEWRVTMINSGRTEGELERKRISCIERILNECGLNGHSDESPEMV